MANSTLDQLWYGCKMKKIPRKNEEKKQRWMNISLVQVEISSGFKFIEMVPRTFIPLQHWLGLGDSSIAAAAADPVYTGRGSSSTSSSSISSSSAAANPSITSLLQRRQGCSQAARAVRQPPISLRSDGAGARCLSSGQWGLQRLQQLQKWEQHLENPEHTAAGGAAAAISSSVFRGSEFLIRS
ncbi:hypothetical protein NC653_038866 [Populus alba x Populus x berolinensis]|uniref:Uncharacterized protein n=1 Tax=Populus alba x Populus x berolinensis TaxID=444605 RepID=A0AAD6LHR3_9ROSI|nr:hypothetical protein NC653_038866 [Populus alba x Populus x berolinensis]